MPVKKKRSLKFSRREFLVKTGAVGLGALAAPFVALWKNKVSAQTKKAALKVSKYPWGYKKIDPEYAANLAYENWHKGYCSYATVAGILIPLQESIGEPYASLPLEAFCFGHGGVVGWGTICGVLMGSGISIGFIAGKEGDKILNEVINWYCDTALPTYTPLVPKAKIKNTTISNSPLCHISIRKWIKKEGAALSSPERKERCARCAASTAFKTVTLLNDWSVGKFKSARPLPMTMYNMPAQHNCTDCHRGEIPKIP